MIDGTDRSAFVGIPRVAPVDAADAAALAQAAALMREYAALPHVDGRWPDWAADIAALPAPFVAPRGALLLATIDRHAVGCVALAPLPEAEMVEMKRLYVRPAARGHGIGEVLVRASLTHATRLGYRMMRLDTAPELHAARALYQREGFQPIPHYRAGLLADALCFERRL